MNMAPFLLYFDAGQTADLVQVYIPSFLSPERGICVRPETVYFRFSQTHDKQKLYNTPVALAAFTAASCSVWHSFFAKT